MANHLIIASDVTPYEGPPIPAPEVYELMMNHGCWEFPAAAAHLKHLQEGDRVVFYLGGKYAKYFAGEAKVAGDFKEITKKSPITFDRNLVPFFTWRLPLNDIERYPPKAVGLDEMMDLSFARAKEITRPYIGLLLRVAIRPLTNEDLVLLRGCLTKSVAPAK